MRWTIRIGFLLILGTLSVPLIDHRISHWKSEREKSRTAAIHAELADQGRVEAEQDIAAGKRVLRTYGLVAPWAPRESRLLRDELGVSCECVGDCMASPEVTAKTRGYNERMTEEIERRFGSDAVAKIRLAAIREHHLQNKN